MGWSSSGPIQRGKRRVFILIIHGEELIRKFDSPLLDFIHILVEFLIRTTNVVADAPVRRVRLESGERRGGF